MGFSIVAMPLEQLKQEVGWVAHSRWHESYQLARVYRTERWHTVLILLLQDEGREVELTPSIPASQCNTLEKAGGELSLADKLSRIERWYIILSFLL